MDELRMEVGVKECFKKKWRGMGRHGLERMGCEKLAKTADALKVEWKRRRERPKRRLGFALKET